MKKIFNYLKGKLSKNNNNVVEPEEMVEEDFTEEDLEEFEQQEEIKISNKEKAKLFVTNHKKGFVIGSIAVVGIIVVLSCSKSNAKDVNDDDKKYTLSNDNSKDNSINTKKQSNSKSNSVSIKSTTNSEKEENMVEETKEENKTEEIKEENIVEETKEENIVEENKEEVANIEVSLDELRNDNIVTYDEYVTTYLEFANKYITEEKLLTVDDVNAIEYVYNKENLENGVVENLINTNYIPNSNEQIINDMSSVLNKIINYNINEALSNKEDKNYFRFSSSIVSKEQKEAYEKLEDLAFASIDSKNTKEQRKENWTKYYNIITGDAAMFDENDLDLYNQIYKLNSMQRYMLKETSTLPLVINGIDGINAPINVEDKKTTINDVLTDIIANNSNPLAMEEDIICPPESTKVLK